MTKKMLLSALALMVLGCASAPPPPVRRAYVYATDADPISGRPVNVGQVDMPPGETFAGSYYSAQLGDMFLDQTGTTVTGTYEYDRAACHATGRIEGRVAGTLLRFTWTESQATCGRPAPIVGHAYFLWWQERNADGTMNVRLNGDWGFGDEEVGGGRWSAMRDRMRRSRRSTAGAPSSGGESPAPTSSAPPAAP